MPNPPPASSRNPAFQSKLEPHLEFIRECRAKRWSYPRIAEALRVEHDLSVAPSSIFNFVKVRAKRRRLYTLPSMESPTTSSGDAGGFFNQPEQPNETKRKYNIH